jgi:hypothetical protein
MQGHRLIRAPSQPYDVALFDTDQPHGVGNATVRDLEVEGELRGHSAEERAARCYQQERPCKRGKHEADAKHWLPSLFNDPNSI